MSTERKLRQYRQGDVLLREVEQIPADALRETGQSGVVVLAYGEATGHAHVIDSNLVTSYLSGERRFIEARLGAALRHEEHEALYIVPGCYEVIRQREYEPSGFRGVLD